VLHIPDAKLIYQIYCHHTLYLRLYCPMQWIQTIWNGFYAAWIMCTQEKWVEHGLNELSHHCNTIFQRRRCISRHNIVLAMLWSCQHKIIIIGSELLPHSIGRESNWELSVQALYFMWKLISQIVEHDRTINLDTWSNTNIAQYQRTFKDT